MKRRVTVPSGGGFGGLAGAPWALAGPGGDGGGEAAGDFVVAGAAVDAEGAGQVVVDVAVGGAGERLVE